LETRDSGGAEEWDGRMIEFFFWKGFRKSLLNLMSEFIVEVDGVMFSCGLDVFVGSFMQLSDTNAMSIQTQDLARLPRVVLVKHIKVTKVHVRTDNGICV
jgi:hypothetical protein